MIKKILFALSLILFFSNFSHANEWKKIVQGYQRPIFKINTNEFDLKSNSEINWELKKQGLNYLLLLNNDYKEKVKVDYNLISSSWHTEQIKSYVDKAESYSSEAINEIEKRINSDIEKTLQGLKEYDLAISFHRIYSIEETTEELNHLIKKQQEEIKSLKIEKQNINTQIDNLMLRNNIAMGALLCSILMIFLLFNKVKSKRA